VPDFDVVVVGGGPAGLASAIAARRQGLTVAVLDCAAPAIDKACGEALMPESLTALGEMGIRFDSSTGLPFRGIRFVGDGCTAAAAFPGEPALGLRRLALHRALVTRAEASGVALHWRALEIELAPGGVRHSRGLVRSRWVIGADGQNSRIRHAAGLAAASREKRRYAFRRHYRIAPWTDCMELYWGANCQIYVTPVGPAQVGVAVISSLPHLRVDAALAAFPALEARLRYAAPCSSERGALTVSRTLRSVQRGRVALVGDASGSVDAITGEGLGLCFRQALALAAALSHDNLEQYQAAHDRISRRPRVMARMLLLLANHDGLRGRVLRTFAQNNQIFERLLAVHIGARPALQIGVDQILRLGWRILTV
jgi:flavin-dependent dehydrogenase